MPEEPVIDDGGDSTDEDDDLEYMLGFVSEPAAPHSLRRHHFPSKLGGRPAWLDPVALPTKEQLTCKTSGQCMQFLLQVYAPLDEDRAHPAAFHRALFLFVSPKGAALGKAGGVRALRCQLPRANSIYPYDAPAASDVSPPALPAELQARSLQRDPWRSIAHDGTCPPLTPPAAGTPPASTPSPAPAPAPSGSADTALSQVPADGPAAEASAAEAPAAAQGGAGPGLLPELELVVEPEERETAQEEAAMQRLMSDYEAKVADEGELSEDELPPEVLQQVEEVLPPEAKHFLMFQARVACAPDQVIRYCFQPGSGALWPSPHQLPGMTSVPPCPLCGKPRQFEFQVMPQLLNHLGQDELDEDALDWGTLAVYTCPDSCDTRKAQAQTGSAYVDEFVWVQPSS